MAVYEHNHRNAKSENLVIFQDVENAENAGCRRGKMAIEAQRNPLQERSVFGQNTTKLQQPKTSKQQQGTGLENCAPKYFSQDIAWNAKSEASLATVPVSQKPFSIFQDNKNGLDSKLSVSSSLHEVCREEQMELHPSVAGMFKPEVVSVSADAEVEDADASMVLDTPEMSLSEDDEGLADDVVGAECNQKYLWFPEYKTDIYQYLRNAEVRHAARSDYMRKQVDITYGMRSILVDWMVEVAEEYKLDRETLCLSVSYVDRFLSLMAVARGKLQLVGAAAMFIASKYEEIYPPEVTEFVYITDNTYTKKQVLQMERMILRALSFDIASPTVNWFTLALLNDLQAGERTSSLAMYLVELSMLDGERFLKYLPSVISTSCVCFAHHTLGYTGFMETVSNVTGYSFADLSACINDVLAIFVEAPSLPHPAIREKYSKEKWHCVSTIRPAAQSEPISLS